MGAGRKSGWLAMAAALGTLILGVPAEGATVAQPSTSVGVPTQVTLPAAVSHASFRNQGGATVSLSALKGRTVFVVPLLTLCGDTCPFTSGDLLQLENLIAARHLPNVSVVAIDVDPFRDSVARIRAYARLFKAPFQIWTPTGATSTPTLTKAELKSANPVGTGDTNPNLSAIERFLHWTVQVVPQGNPPSTDWMKPYEKLTYDISHSDGFWVISKSQQVRFVGGAKPHFVGTLPKVLSTFMGYKSDVYTKATYAKGWTPAEALQAIRWVRSLGG